MNNCQVLVASGPKRRKRPCRRPATDTWKGWDMCSFHRSRIHHGMVLAAEDGWCSTVRGQGDSAVVWTPARPGEEYPHPFPQPVPTRKTHTIDGEPIVHTQIGNNQ